MVPQLSLDFILKTDLPINNTLLKTNKKYSSHKSIRNYKEGNLFIKLTKKHFKNGYNFKIRKNSSNDD